MPNIPDINPEIDLYRDDVIDVLLLSIGLEELSLAHIENAEAEKIQYVLSTHPSCEELFKANKSVERMLRTVIKKEMLLQFKLEDILDYLIEGPCEHRCRK